MRDFSKSKGSLSGVLMKSLFKLFYSCGNPRVHPVGRTLAENSGDTWNPCPRGAHTLEVGGREHTDVGHRASSVEKNKAGERVGMAGRDGSFK